MSRVQLTNVNVSIPIYDSHALRLIRIPSFHRSSVGTNSATESHGVIVMNAIKDLTLDLSDGDRVALIGHNGAGKTTLLRLVAGIYPATSGTINVVGKIYTLLTNSMSLNSDATGYENIKLIANLYDWPRADMIRTVQDIKEFTELGEYLSLPTRVYSAGMQARLAFAIATAQTPEILLIDEGIGAGDARFREKAENRITQFVSRSRIILLASHSADLCRAMCNKALLLRHGSQVFFGDIDEAFRLYMSDA